jgi:hypothetical protein
MTAAGIVFFALAAVLLTAAAVVRERAVPADGAVGREPTGRRLGVAVLVVGGLAVLLTLARMVQAAL